MKNWKTTLALSSATVLLVAGGTFGLNQSIHKNISEAKTEVKSNTIKLAKADFTFTDSDVDTSQPTEPIENGQVNTDFVDRFDNAVSLNSTTGQFEIDKTALPDNASDEELAALNKMVDASNVALAQAIKIVPKVDMVQSDNSVVISDNPQTSQEIAQDSQIVMTSTYHEGSTYVHYYWWGMRIGISKTMIHTIGQDGINSSAAIGALASALGKSRPDVAAILGEIGGVTWFFGVGLTKVPGGFVFNFTAGAPANGVWGLEWQ
ncbi:hypothetical protein [Lactococcus allomyrinae]|uniref:Uncharacterized protein n=1 Tax=Lactococcus allomyrinae TaxID=2419773 RepID=A0A387BH08_9LACT|nr:hypothetical protein [Lactococcus allomyrinae]AYG01544.1 hypothetical protein D7I46_11000 [Lactococcus allomyrinae]